MGNSGGKNRRREKNTERGRPNGGKHLRGENPWQESSKHPERGTQEKEKPKRGNNPQQESNKKLRKKKEWRERKKVVKQKEKILQE